MRFQPFSAGVSARGRVVVVASMSGRGGGPGDSPLILGPNGKPMGRPGGPQGGPGRLIMPGQFNQGPGGRQQRPPGLGLSDMDGGGLDDGMPKINKYRPPPGFMNDDVQDPALVATDPQEMLNRLRNRAGRWHSLAKLLPVLYAKGFDTNTIAEITGVNPADQNAWVVAGTVYESLVASGQVDEDVLSYFDNGGEELLYHFRFLSVEKRAAAAKYIAAQQLDPRACDILARSMKEWDRRPGERAGFSDSPGDCMAFKYLRDASECRSSAEKQEKLDLAFAVVETGLARERLLEWQATMQEAAAAAASSSSRAVLTVLRLSQDELGFRPLPQVSPLQSVTPAELADAPSTSQEGAFGAFDLPSGASSVKWVALPQWKALALAVHPVAVPLADCSQFPSVLAASKVKTDDEVRRLTGAGLLVVDTATPASPDQLDPNTYYLVGSGPGQLQLVDGGRLAAAAAADGGGGVPGLVATVLFLCRPPNRESAITSSELLQL